MRGGDGEVGVLGWRDVEFAPEGRDVFLLVVHAGVLHHMEADGGMGAVRSYQKVKGYF